MIRTAAIVLLVASVGVLCTAAKEKQVDFITDGQFAFGMELAEANQRLEKDEKNLAVMYRVDTPSTNEFVCVYKETEFYRVRFFEGRCYFIERRAEIDAGRVPELFTQFGEAYGETPESTQSRDQRLWYGHWMLQDRDVELTAYQRDGDLYVVTYQEFEPLTVGEALRVQETELGSGPMEVDPVTGKLSPAQHQVEDDEQSAEGEGEGEESEAEGEGEEEGEEPPPEDDDDDWDWYD